MVKLGTKDGFVMMIAIINAIFNGGNAPLVVWVLGRTGVYPLVRRILDYGPFRLRRIINQAKLMMSGHGYPVNLQENELGRSGEVITEFHDLYGTQLLKNFERWEFKPFHCKCFTGWFQTPRWINMYRDQLTTSELGVVGLTIVLVWRGEFTRDGRPLKPHSSSGNYMYNRGEWYQHRDEWYQHRGKWYQRSVYTLLIKRHQHNMWRLQQSRMSRRQQNRMRRRQEKSMLLLQQKRMLQQQKSMRRR